MVEALYPQTLEEALRMKNEYIDTNVYAGGTDWMVRRKEEAQLLFIGHLKQIKKIARDEHTIYIGAGCTYNELLESSLVPKILREAIKGIASPAVRNIGTMGGNICNASPAGDTLPVLYALGAKLKVMSIQVIEGKAVTCERVVPIEEFILGIRKTSLEPNELLVEIQVPRKVYQNVYYKKIGARKSEAISKLSFVGLAQVEENQITDLRITFGSVNTTVVRLPKLEQICIGEPIEKCKENIEGIKGIYSVAIKPITDQRSTSDYRMRVCLNLLGDFIQSIK